jgi:hypothetical protein
VIVGRTGCVRQLCRMSAIDGLDAPTRSRHRSELTVTRLAPRFARAWRVVCKTESKCGDALRHLMGDSGRRASAALNHYRGNPRVGRLTRVRFLLVRSAVERVGGKNRPEPIRSVLFARCAPLSPSYQHHRIGTCDPIEAVFEQTVARFEERGGIRCLGSESKVSACRRFSA